MTTIYKKLATLLSINNYFSSRSPLPIWTNPPPSSISYNLHPNPPLLPCSLILFKTPGDPLVSNYLNPNVVRSENELGNNTWVAYTIRAKWRNKGCEHGCSFYMRSKQIMNHYESSFAFPPISFSVLNIYEWGKPMFLVVIIMLH